MMTVELKQSHLMKFQTVDKEKWTQKINEFFAAAFTAKRRKTVIYVEVNSCLSAFVEPPKCQFAKANCRNYEVISLWSEGTIALSR